MKPESIVLTVAGMCFGVIVGWVLATIDAERVARAPVAQAASAPQAPASAGNEGQTPTLDEARVQALTTIIKNDPKNAGAAVQLGTTYFEADRFEEAIKWYQEGLRLDPRNVDASTQLGMTYFFTQGPDPALQQLEQSLKIAPDDPRTLLNKGIVLWRGKQDTKGAATVWQRLVKVAPESQEAQIARQGLDAITGDHKDGGAGNQ